MTHSETTIHSETMTPANDEYDAVALLIEAHRISADPVTRQYIELALVHEGRKISGTLSPDKKRPTGSTALGRDSVEVRLCVRRPIAGTHTP